jgi:hypothetical protein
MLDVCRESVLKWFGTYFYSEVGGNRLLWNVGTYFPIVRSHIEEDHDYVSLMPN